MEYLQQLREYDAPFPVMLRYETAAYLVLTYLATIAMIWLYMRRRDKHDVSTIMAWHNLALCLYSVTSTIGGLYAAYEVAQEQGALEMYCNDTGNTYEGTSRASRALKMLVYLFYLSKYWEFADTVLLLLRKRPLIFLHVYHHCAVVPWTINFIRNQHGPYVWGMIINTGIHSFMYWYYFNAARGRDVWWKRYLTVAQMVQFAFGMSLHMLWARCGAGVPGTNGWLCFYANMFLLLSFLVLFANFYRGTYSDKRAAKKQH